MDKFSNLAEIDQEQALNLIKFFIKSNQNLFLFGRRGIGKTHLVLQAAKECNYKVNYINLSVIERPDLAGYPDFHADSNIVSFKSPYYLPELLENETPNNILLFDELDKASPEVTAPLLEILQFKKINGKPLGVASCVLTGNLLNEGAFSNQVSSALLDRGSKYLLSFHFEKWLDWARSNDVHDLILGFLSTNQELICGKYDDIQYASPSPRSWTLASDALCKAKELKISDAQSICQIVSGFVGKEVGLKFKIWYENYKKFDPYIHALLEYKEMNFNYKNLIPSEKLIFVVSTCYLAKQKTLLNIKNKNKFLYLENLCHFFDKYEIDLELQTIGISNSFSFENITKHKLYSCKIFFDHFTKLNEKIIFKK